MKLRVILIANDIIFIEIHYAKILNRRKKIDLSHGLLFAKQQVCVD